MKYVITTTLLVLFSCQVFGYGDYLDKLLSDPSISSTKISEEEIQNIKENVVNIYKVGTGEIQDDDPDKVTGYLPIHLKAEYTDMAKELYLNGIAKTEHFIYFQDEYKKLLELTPPVGVDPKVFWLEKYKGLFNAYLAKVKSDPQTCAQEGSVASNRKCCAGLVALTEVEKPSGVYESQCIDSNLKCSESTQCCSGLCVKKEGSPSGFCSSVKRCYKLIEGNGECSAQNPYCKSGYCRKVNSQTVGLGECKKDGNTCNTSTDCCSSKCQNGKCVEKSVCTDCVGVGKKATQGQVCCEGLYKAGSGKCRLLYNPLLPLYQGSEYKPKQTPSLIERIINIIIPTAHAQDDSTCSGENALTTAQRNALQKKITGCEGDQKCLEKVNRLQNTYCHDNKTKLTNEQENTFDNEKKSCLLNADGTPSTASETEIQACIKAIDEKMNKAKEENVDQGMAEGGINKYGDFTNKYTAPVVTAKTYSDPKACEFHTFNDSWKSASNIEKNAELFLRSFEFVYSGKGTIDYWDEAGDGKSIFPRAQKVARKFRENRAKLIKRAEEIDKEMTCKCIAIWGPEEFSVQKQRYFSTECTQEAAELSQKLATNDQANTEGGSNVDGTTISDTSKLEKDTARIEEIDKGALALSHEKLLIEFLQLRSEAHMDRFVDNSELEEELTALSDYIAEVEFEEVWKDKFEPLDTDENKMHIVYNSPNGDTRVLYRWSYKYGGFLKFLIMILAVVVAVLTAGAGASLAAMAIAGLKGLVVGALLSSFVGGYEGAMPGVGDIQDFKKAKYSTFKKWDGYTRYYIGPLYDNPSNNYKTNCRIFAKASACLKSAYEFDPSDSQFRYYTELGQSKSHYILDPKLPLFVNPNEISINKMPIYNKTWVQIMNETVEEGVAFLKTTKPEGGEKAYGQNKYIVTSKSFRDRDVFKEAMDKKYFIPMRGNFSAQKFSKRNAIVSAATKYGMCKDFVGNATDLSCNTNIGTKPGDIGYGYLFEEESEAREWAQYTYEMHYIYSSITRDKYMGYPLMGLDVYFQAVAYNMRLVGSLATARSENYSDTAQAYIADWEKRKDNYKSLGETEIGGFTHNITYREGFRAAFKMLSFNSTTNLEEFDAIVANAKKSNSFNRSELAALAAGRNKAARLNEDIKKKEEFTKAIAKIPGAALTLKKQSKLMNRLTKPVDAILSVNPGGAISKGRFGLSGNTGKSLLNASSGKVNNINSQANIQKPNFTIPDYGQGGLGMDGIYSEGSVGADEGLDTAAYKNQEMSPDEAQNIINRLNKDKDLKTRFDDESLWTIVSKAYKRNYSKVLYMRKDLEEKVPSKKNKMKLEGDSSLKKLLIKE